MTWLLLGKMGFERKVFMTKDNENAHVAASPELLCSEARARARKSTKMAALQLKPETIGVACEITGIEDPAVAISSLIDEALVSWARLKYADWVALIAQQESEVDVSDGHNISKTFTIHN